MRAQFKRAELDLHRNQVLFYHFHFIEHREQFMYEHSFVYVCVS